MTNFLGLLQTTVLPAFDGAIENTSGLSSQFLHDLTSGIMRRVDPVRHWHSSSSLRSDFFKKNTQLHKGCSLLELSLEIFRQKKKQNCCKLASISLLLCLG